jgi:RNA polymerase sigma-70 factor (ECF subfamily)
MQQLEDIYPHSQDISDNALIRQSLAGNPDAFEILIYRYRAPLQAFIFRYLRNEEETFDMLQQIFLQLYVSFPTLLTARSIKPWLFQVAHNGCLDELRKRKRRRVSNFSELELLIEGEDWSPLALIPDPQPLPEEVVEHHDLQRMIQSAILTLPPKPRAVVLLRYSTQMSFSKIGQTLNIPEATVKTYFRRARPALVALLKASIGSHTFE